MGSDDRKQFRKDAERVASVEHQVDDDDLKITLFFSPSHLPEEILYAVALHGDDTIQITLDCSRGYRTAESPLPVVSFEDAGGVKDVLHHAIKKWMAPEWRRSGSDGSDNGNFLEKLACFASQRLASITQCCPFVWRQARIHVHAETGCVLQGHVHVAIHRTRHWVRPRIRGAQQSRGRRPALVDDLRCRHLTETSRHACSLSRGFCRHDTRNEPTTAETSCSYRCLSLIKLLSSGIGVCRDSRTRL